MKLKEEKQRCGYCGDKIKGARYRVVFWDNRNWRIIDSGCYLFLKENGIISGGYKLKKDSPKTNLKKRYGFK